MQVKNQLNSVRCFHEVFQAYMERTPTAKVPVEISQGRIQMFLEELAEYRAAIHNHDIVEIADALTDMLYVLLGTFITHGLQDIAEELFDEVHRSNMSKLDEASHIQERRQSVEVRSVFRPGSALDHSENWSS